jgi:galactokinase
VTALRDVKIETLLAAEKELDEKTFKRARHVVTENDRTEAAKLALQVGVPQYAGKYMRRHQNAARAFTALKQTSCLTSISLIGPPRRFAHCFMQT